MRTCDGLNSTGAEAKLSRNIVRELQFLHSSQFRFFSVGSNSLSPVIDYLYSYCTNSARIPFFKFFLEKQYGNKFASMPFALLPLVIRSILHPKFVLKSLLLKLPIVFCSVKCCRRLAFRTRNSGQIRLIFII